MVSTTAATATAIATATATTAAIAAAAATAAATAVGAVSLQPQQRRGVSDVARGDGPVGRARHQVERQGRDVGPRGDVAAARVGGEREKEGRVSEVV